MNVSETKQKILELDDFVISELKKIQTLYELKKVIRYDHSREVEIHTESVAEHIFGMQCLIDYFLPLENPEKNWDENKIRQISIYHDIDEIVTGDIVGYRKSDTEEQNEIIAANEVIKNLPLHTQNKIILLLDEYKQNKSPEAKFVKAIDKIEPIFHLYNQTGKETLTKLQTTREQHDRIKHPHVEDFVTIKRFMTVMSEQFDKEDFFHKKS